MTIEALLLAALLSVPHPPTETDARALASVVAVAALDRPLWPVVSELAPESAEVAATGLLLLAIGYHESGADPRVADCRLRGNDDTVTAFQLLGRVALAGYSKAELCASPHLAAYAGLRVLELQRNRCPACGPAAWVAGYASGDMGKVTRPAREILGIYWRFARGAGVDITGARPRWR
jgi:hypothetical protein